MPIECGQAKNIDANRVLVDQPSKLVGQALHHSNWKLPRNIGAWGLDDNWYEIRADAVSKNEG